MGKGFRILVGAGEGNFAGAGQFEHAELLHEVEEFPEFSGGAGDLDGEGFILHIDDFGAEDGADLHDFGTGLGSGLDAAEDEFAIDVFFVAEVLDVDDIHELLELFVDLLEDFVIAADNDGHAGGAGIEGRAHVEGVDIEAASGEHAGHAGQNAEFVFNQNGKSMPHTGVGAREKVWTMGEKDAGRQWNIRIRVQKVWRVSDPGWGEWAGRLRRRGSEWGKRRGLCEG